MLAAGSCRRPSTPAAWMQRPPYPRSRRLAAAASWVEISMPIGYGRGQAGNEPGEQAAVGAADVDEPNRAGRPTAGDTLHDADELVATEPAMTKGLESPAGRVYERLLAAAAGRLLGVGHLPGKLLLEHLLPRRIGQVDKPGFEALAEIPGQRGRVEPTGGAFGREQRAMSRGRGGKHRCSPRTWADRPADSLHFNRHPRGVTVAAAGRRPEWGSCGLSGTLPIRRRLPRLPAQQCTNHRLAKEEPQTIRQTLCPSRGLRDGVGGGVGVAGGVAFVHAVPGLAPGACMGTGLWVAALFCAAIEAPSASWGTAT